MYLRPVLNGAYQDKFKKSRVLSYVDASYQHGLKSHSSSRATSSSRERYGISSRRVRWIGVLGGSPCLNTWMRTHPHSYDYDVFRSAE